MATPRKNWSRLFDQILRMGWPDATVADFVRLQAFLNERWARDGLTPAEAGVAVLTPQQMMLITHTRSLRSAWRRLLALPTITPMGELRVREVRTGRELRVEIELPNLATYQAYQEREHPLLGRSSGELAPDGARSETNRDETKQNTTPLSPSFSSSEAGRLGQKLSPVPEDLGEEEKRSFSRWIRQRHPYYRSVAKRRELVDACLTHHRARGTVAADWEAQCRTWVERQARYDGEQPVPMALTAHAPLPGAK